MKKYDLLSEIRRRTHMVGSSPDGNSAPELVCARMRHVAGTQWSNKKYMNYLETAVEDVSIADLLYSSQRLQTNLRVILVGTVSKRQRHQEQSDGAATVEIQ